MSCLVRRAAEPCSCAAEGCSSRSRDARRRRACARHRAVERREASLAGAPARPEGAPRSCGRGRGGRRIVGVQRSVRLDQEPRERARRGEARPSPSRARSRAASTTAGVSPSRPSRRRPSGCGAPTTPSRGSPPRQGAPSTARWRPPAAASPCRRGPRPFPARSRGSDRRGRRPPCVRATWPDEKTDQHQERNEAEEDPERDRGRRPERVVRHEPAGEAPAAMHEDAAPRRARASSCSISRAEARVRVRAAASPHFTVTHRILEPDHAVRVPRQSKRAVRESARRRRPVWAARRSTANPQRLT